LLDMRQESHFGIELDDVNNTEELSVTVAASIIDRLMDQSMPVSLASNADRDHIYRPDSSPEQRGRLMEALSEVRAQGERPLQEFIYEFRSHLNQFNALTVVTSAVDIQWVGALNDLRHQGVEVAAVLVDRSSFGSAQNMDGPLEALSANLIPAYVVRRGDSLNDVLQVPVREIPRSWTSGVAGGSG
jgi:uncharacterized protein (DUF58 family)